MNKMLLGEGGPAVVEAQSLDDLKFLDEYKLWNKLLAVKGLDKIELDDPAWVVDRWEELPSWARNTLLFNPSCPEVLLRRAYECGETRVVHNLGCPPEILEHYAQNRPYLTEEGSTFLALHPRCPASVLEKLVRCSRPHVVRMALRHPNCPVHLLREKAQDETLLWFVINNPKCPEDVLQEASRCASALTREAALQRLRERD